MRLGHRTDSRNHDAAPRCSARGSASAQVTRLTASSSHLTPSTCNIMTDFGPWGTPRATVPDYLFVWPAIVSDANYRNVQHPLIMVGALKQLSVITHPCFGFWNKLTTHFHQRACRPARRCTLSSAAAAHASSCSSRYLSSAVCSGRTRPLRPDNAWAR